MAPAVWLIVANVAEELTSSIFRKNIFKTEAEGASDALLSIRSSPEGSKVWSK
jgi:hypothetical protein